MLKRERVNRRYYITRADAPLIFLTTLNDGIICGAGDLSPCQWQRKSLTERVRAVGVEPHALTNFGFGPQRSERPAVRSLIR